ncbi:hypothetical protein GH714_032377 [Hevea brasiliensis]|uniref:Uncharacterized protein n=1 Tax=Hevea brasiliensis TaxID=3981 RepID=A0A6A6KBP0_HEVBR|nr:hypothetical protein GH714_032377 [Hevea brasiliensis]
MDILKRGSKVWLTELLANLDILWENVDSDVSEKGSSSYIFTLQQSMFKFLIKSLVGADPSTSPEIEKNGYAMLDQWLALQLLPTVHIGVAQPLVEIFLHSFAYPSFLVSGDYNKLAQFIRKEGTVASDTTGLQERLRKEARENGGPSLTFDSVKEMPLVQSVVYETFRLNPPVPLQYARARKDFQLSSHDSVYDIKKGELLCGYQTLVMRDPKTDSPNASNKQCAAKDYVTLTACLIVAHMFRRYDSITGSSSSITAVEKAK